MTKILVGCTLLAVTLAGGCLSTTQRREDNLVRLARTFNDDWRWARWEAMATVMPKMDAAAFRGRVAALESELQLADFEVIQVNFGPGSDSALVTARFEWYLKRDPRVRDTTVEERWEHRDGAWQVVKLRRVRGDRFGLVTEPTTPPPAGAAR
jgi:hypothetical protein